MMGRKMAEPRFCEKGGVGRTSMERKLYRYGGLRKMVCECEQDLKEELGKKEAFIEGQIKAMPPDRVRVAGGERPDPVYNAVCVLIEVASERIGNIKRRLMGLYSEYDDARMALYRAGVTAQEMEYIRCRYEEGRSVTETASVMNYSESRLRQVRVSILRKLEAAGWGLKLEAAKTE